MTVKISSARITARLRSIKVVATDVDGVLTAGEIIILGGEDLKIWNVRDRLGLAMLKNAGSPVIVAFVTGRASADVRLRAEECRAMLYERCADKKKAMADLAAKSANALKNIAAIGDDIIDLPMLRVAGLAVCPSDAHPEVKKNCHLVLGAAGGRGALREFIELLLKAKGLWRKAIEPYAADKS